MTNKTNSTDNQSNNYVNITIDLILKVGALFLVVFLCFKILKPFLGMLLWGLIIAIILFPLFQRLRGWLGKRNKLSSIILTIVALSILTLPSIWLVNQLVEGVKLLAGNLQAGDLHITPPSESVADWPVIGNWLYDHWLEISENREESLKGFMPQILAWGEKTLGTLANTGLGILQFAASIIIAGIFLIFSEKGTESGRRIFQKVVGDRGEEFLDISLKSIRNVATGVLGVAIIQTTLMGVGLILADIPLAAVWIVLILVMTMAQIPVLLFNIPLIIYIFAFMDPLPAVLWMLYFLVMGMIDNILKPLLMGKGASVPMLVIFLGALGGFMAFGFIGLFLGSIVLSLAYKLYLTWVTPEAA
ncbi:MAG: AI-2E family transporter [Bacteroidetes bacterium]|nr:AI-2E family transporter [Bacteroidota bacterium]